MREVLAEIDSSNFFEAMKDDVKSAEQFFLKQDMNAFRGRLEEAIDAQDAIAVRKLVTEIEAKGKEFTDGLVEVLGDASNFLQLQEAKEQAKELTVRRADGIEMSAKILVHRHFLFKRQESK